MSITTDLLSASLSFIPREDLPLVTTGTTTSSTSSTSSSSSSSSSSIALITLSSTSSLTGMPTVDTSTSTSTSTLSYTTPSMVVPSTNGNPYIIRTSLPLGTVFIAVGSIVIAILLGFALFHLIKSFSASSLAKKTVNNEKLAHQKFAYNNNVAYGNPGFFEGTEYKGSVSKLPLVNGSQFLSGMAGGLGTEYSSSGISDSERAASRQDLTNMFISPTKEMTSNRAASHNFSNSVTSLSVYGRSYPDSGHGISPNKNPSIGTNYYMNDSINNSEYNLALETNSSAAAGERKPRNPIPSMYLEDLIDN